jgi:thiamine pyrophosphokinase
MDKNKKSPLVSICIPTKDRPVYLKQAIESVLSQNFSDMEKALVYALEFKPDQINVLAATGKRSDHYVANLLCFEKFAAEHEDIELFVYDNYGVFDSNDFINFYVIDERNNIEEHLVKLY